jgi:hypothetical protein
MIFRLLEMADDMESFSADDSVVKEPLPQLNTDERYIETQSSSSSGYHEGFLFQHLGRPTQHLRNLGCQRAMDISLLRTSLFVPLPCHLSLLVVQTVKGA